MCITFWSISAVGIVEVERKKWKKMQGKKGRRKGEARRGGEGEDSVGIKRCFQLTKKNTNRTNPCSERVSLVCRTILNLPICAGGLVNNKPDS